MKPATPTMQTTVGFFSPLATILCCACDCGDAGSAQWWDESTARSGERELAREFDACYRVRRRAQGRDAVRGMLFQRTKTFRVLIPGPTLPCFFFRIARYLFASNRTNKARAETHSHHRHGASRAKQEQRRIATAGPVGAVAAL